ncbi:MAG TPA: DUF308 domain-containing protein [Candidatus Aquicultor sp.]|jgi:uncharacterized membrane protein HdeD (DUF308 family)
MMNPTSDMNNMTRAEAEQISRSWWLFLANGILSIIAGIIILAINWTLLSLAYFVGAVLIVRGIFQMFSPSSSGGSRVWNVTIGIISAIIGIAIIAYPSFAAFSLVTLALFIGIWLVISGIAAIVGSIANRDNINYWGLGLAAGILVTTLGLFALYRPILTLAVTIAVVGIWAIVIGTMEITTAFEMRRLPEMISMRAAQAGPSEKRVA